MAVTQNNSENKDYWIRGGWVLKQINWGFKNLLLERKRNMGAILITWVFVLELFLGYFHRQQLISILTVGVLLFPFHIWGSWGLGKLRLPWGPWEAWPLDAGSKGNAPVWFSSVWLFEGLRPEPWWLLFSMWVFTSPVWEQLWIPWPSSFLSGSQFWGHRRQADVTVKVWWPQVLSLLCCAARESTLTFSWEGRLPPGMLWEFYDHVMGL